jgi:hypothetical protein
MSLIGLATGQYNQIGNNLAARVQQSVNPPQMVNYGASSNLGTSQSVNGYSGFVDFIDAEFEAWLASNPEAQEGLERLRSANAPPDVQNQFRQSMRQIFTDQQGGRLRAKWDEIEGDKAKKAKEDADLEQWKGDIRAFADELRQPWDQLQKDPRIKAIVDDVQGRMQMANRDIGSGGLSGQGMSRALLATQTGIMGNRDQLAAQILNMGVGDARASIDGRFDRDRFKEDQYRFDTNQFMQQYAQQNNRQGALGAGIGGVLGGLAGGAASFIPGLQSFAPQLIGAGINTGSYLGGGMGLSGGPSYRPPARGASRSYSYRDAW